LEFLDREIARSKRHQRPLALVLFDIDHFKAINDELGHLGGDFALRELTACVRDVCVRHEDLLARYGGEEFVLVLVETSKDDALNVAERVRRTVESHNFRFEDRTFSLTVSLGVAVTTGEPNVAAADLLAQADAKMYEAKRAGRNRIQA
jgi:diguanylate cyclase (GGDEF)-like protein